MRTEASRLFDELNRRYWRGRLPRYQVIRRTQLPGRALGICNNRGGTILLQKDLTGEPLRLTLLHEMCHIGTPLGYGHGPLFLNKLRRLARQGEPKVLEDIEQYDGTVVERYIEAERAKGKEIPEIPFSNVISSDLEAFAIENYRRRWPTVLRWLATQYNVTPAYVQRAALRAEREWRNLARFYRYEERARKALEEGRLPPPFKE